LEISTKYNQKQELARDLSILLGKATHLACYLGLGQIIELFPIMSNINWLMNPASYVTEAQFLAEKA
jgi:hypothetical protein